MQSETKELRFEGVQNLNEHELLKELLRPRPNPFMGTEKEFQKYVVDSIPELCLAIGMPEVLKIEEQRQFTNTLDKCLPDIFVTHIDYTISVFEVKRYRKNLGAGDQLRAIGQILNYGIAIENKTGIRPDLFLIDSHITPQVLAVCQHSKLDISLVELNLNGYVLMPYCKNYRKVEVKND